MESDLEALGWDSWFAERFEQCSGEPSVVGLVPARVAQEARERYLLLGMGAAVWGDLRGRLRHEAVDRLALPAVGDWVTVRREGAAAVVHGVLARRTAVVRQAAGAATAAQVVAANVDVVFVVTSANDDLNPRRLERYVTAVYESGAAPVIVLNKADLAADLAPLCAAIAGAAPGVPVAAVSAWHDADMSALRRHLGRGRSAAFVGSSGVGKSSLVNRLVGAARQAVTEIRVDDDRGRHTTTHRELIVLEDGVLVDTPGMRELALWGDEDATRGAFADVDALAAACRFGDCAHEAEPGCAVQGAVAAGTLAAERLASWRKLARELAHHARREDARARADERRRFKQISRAHRQRAKLTNRDR